MAERKKRDSYLGNPNLPTAFAQHEYDEFRAKELLRCKDDMMHFAENYFYIVHPDDGRIKIPLRNYQKRVLKKVEKNRFFIVCSPRQVGKTAMYTIAALHHACFNADKRIVIIANKEATAIEIFKRVKLAY
jgi:reverse gyrase